MGRRFLKGEEEEKVSQSQPVVGNHGESDEAHDASQAIGSNLHQVQVAKHADIMYQRVEGESENPEVIFSQNQPASRDDLGMDLPTPLGRAKGSQVYVLRDVDFLPQSFDFGVRRR